MDRKPRGALDFEALCHPLPFADVLSFQALPPVCSSRWRHQGHLALRPRQAQEKTRVHPTPRGGPALPEPLPSGAPRSGSHLAGAALSPRPALPFPLLPEASRLQQNRSKGLSAGTKEVKGTFPEQTLI